MAERAGATANTAVVDPEVDESVAANDGADTESNDGAEAEGADGEKRARRETVKAADLEPNERTTIMVGLPAGLKAKVEAEAEEAGLATGYFVRKMLAEKYDYTLPPMERTGPTKKYANDEEREAARKERESKRRAVIRALLARYASGDIEIDAEELAALEAAGKAKGAADDDAAE